jgi:Zn-dependent oligopeptidase
MMFENWCYEEEILSKIAKHYQTGDPLPKELQKNLANSKLAVGFLYRRMYQ